MSIPEGLVSDSTRNKVCKLRMSLYGLKQSSSQWCAKINDFLIRELKFKSSLNDPCLYTRHEDSKVLIIALYVDDLLIPGNSKSDICALKKGLFDKFETKDLGPARVMLDIKIRRDRAKCKFLVPQSEYTKEFLKLFCVSDSRHVSTPMDRSYFELVDQNSPLVDDVPYRQAIGSSMYLMIGSRPDLAFAIGKLSEHAENPNNFHWIAVKRALWYLIGTKDYGIQYDGA